MSTPTRMRCRTSPANIVEVGPSVRCWGGPIKRGAVDADEANQAGRSGLVPCPSRTRIFATASVSHLLSLKSSSACRWTGLLTHIASIVPRLPDTWRMSMGMPTPTGGAATSRKPQKSANLRWVHLSRYTCGLYIPLYNRPTAPQPRRGSQPVFEYGSSFHRKGGRPALNRGFPQQAAAPAYGRRRVTSFNCTTAKATWGRSRWDHPTYFCFGPEGAIRFPAAGGESACQPSA